MATIKINNHTYTGSSVIISNGKILIDGEDQTPETKEVTITVNGNIDSISADLCNNITIEGSSGSIKTMSGDVKIHGDVTGSVSTMSGDVDCYNIGESVSTMSGNITHRILYGDF